MFPNTVHAVREKIILKYKNKPRISSIPLTQLHNELVCISIGGVLTKITVRYARFLCVSKSCLGLTKEVYTTKFSFQWKTEPPGKTKTEKGVTLKCTRMVAPQLKSSLLEKKI